MQLTEQSHCFNTQPLTPAQIRKCDDDQEEEQESDDTAKLSQDEIDALIAELSG